MYIRTQRALAVGQKKLSLAAINAVANARFLKPRLERILAYPDKFVGKLMDHLETEYC